MTWYVYRWGDNPRRAQLKGRRCKVIGRMHMNSVYVEFENGEREVVSRNALRREEKGTQMSSKKKGAKAGAPEPAKKESDQSKADHTLITLEVNASFKTFRPRFMVNGDKMELVFEVDWNHLPEGFLDKIQTVAQKFGTLVFVEADVQAEPKPSKHLPGQPELPLGQEEQIV